MDAVLFDMDGTLADCAHRRVTLPNGKMDWTIFNRNQHLDTVRPAIARLADQLRPANRIVIATGRHEHQRETTLAWMARHGIHHDAMFMRPNGDHRSDEIVKREMLALIRAAGYEPWLVVDDRQRVVDMWRAEGLTCLQCDVGDF